jgi:hypothetical protein
MWGFSRLETRPLQLQSIEELDGGSAFSVGTAKKPASPTAPTGGSVRSRGSAVMPMIILI